MKVIVVKTKDNIWDRDLPFLVETSVGNIVLVTHADNKTRTFRGVLLSSVGSDYPIGEVRDDWIKDSFCLYTGQVTLEN